MHPIGLLLASRSLDLALTHDPHPRPAEPPLGPIASTPETAAAWRRWREAGAGSEAVTGAAAVAGSGVVAGPAAVAVTVPGGRVDARVPGRSPG